MTQAPTWDLDTIFDGGLRGDAFSTELAAVEQAVTQNHAAIGALAPLSQAPDGWAAALLDLQDVFNRINELWTVAHCATCEDTAAADAPRLEARVSALWSKADLAQIPLLDTLARTDNLTWGRLKKQPAWETLRAWIDNERTTAHLRFPKSEETLINQLNEDGKSAWGRIYRRQSSKVRLKLDGTDSPEGELSPGQAWPLLHSGDPALRTRVHTAWQGAWREDRDLWASTLTHIVGTRNVLQDRLGVGPLERPLADCRMSRQTLDAMHEAASRARPLLGRYLARKARVLGLEKLQWQDQWAPVADTAKWSWDQAQAFVEDNFGAWHPDLARFAREAFEGRWVEAEDRSAKAAGAWCASLPRARESRVFMTFGGTFSGAMTLAHELGHAFHNYVTRDLPRTQVHIPMTLAETASVFAENLVRDAALAAAESPTDRLAMLDARLSAGMSFLMNIPARFQFELQLHALRKQGELDPDALDEAMINCQRAAYGESLASWDATYWSSKMHFHMADRAFYNFPYTFGYLFSSLVYARARAEGPSFQATYTELLRRTGTDHAEPLAADLLGLDLTDPDCWWQAIAPLEDDLAAFEATADSL
jgi:oligoendopeptidase F